MKSIREAEYRKALNDDTGFCVTCFDFTRDNTEPDAEEYECPICGGNTVFGAEQAMLLNHINVVGE